MWRFRTKDASRQRGKRLFLMRFIVVLLIIISFSFYHSFPPFRLRTFSIERFTCWTIRCPATKCDPTARTTLPSRHNRWGPISDCSRTISAPAKRWWSSLDFWDSERPNERFRRVRRRYTPAARVQASRPWNNYHFGQLSEFQTDPNGQVLRVVLHGSDQPIVVAQ